MPAPTEAHSSEYQTGQTVLRPGRQVFERYALRKLVGRGGMGVVWLAHDERLDRSVALKFLPEILFCDAAARDDLKRETRRSLDLTHPHVVRIYDFVEDEEMAAIAMEYVDGPTLSELRVDQDSRCFQPEELSVWVGGLCSALDYAHQAARCVHRDLKPGNLMVNARGVLKVADFGISCSLQNTAARVSAWASTGGTLGYMSPQQLLGELASPADDIYSVGATLYELLTGKPPFYSGDLASQIRTVMPDSIAERRRKFGLPNSSIPRDWEETIAACLAKEPGQRPGSAGDIARRLGIAATPTAESAPAMGNDLAPTICSAPTLPVGRGIAGLSLGRFLKWSAPLERWRWPVASAFLLGAAIVPWIARPVREVPAHPAGHSMHGAKPASVEAVFAAPAADVGGARLPAPTSDQLALLSPIPPSSIGTTATAVAPVEAPADTAQVNIETIPPGIPFKILASAYESPLAEVLRTGETPMMVRELPAGAYRIVFSPPSAPTRSASLQVPTEGAVTFQQEFPHGLLQLRSQPDGAEVLCDGQVVGLAPLDWPVSPGRHEVSARWKGRDARVRTIQVADAANQTVSFDFRSGSASSASRARRSKKIEDESMLTKVGRSFKNLFGGDGSDNRKR